MILWIKTTKTGAALTTMLNRMMSYAASIGIAEIEVLI